MEPGDKVKHYELLDRLGEGGMGVVWRARDTRLGRTVALKMLPRELAADEERAHRFEREARVASSLTHPGIATVYDFDRDGEMAFLTMELVRGDTLRTLIDRGPVPIEELIECGAQVAEALVAAHEVGVVHRDLKPENIMSSASGHFKVLDFGIARIGEAGSGELIDTRTPTRTWATKAGTLIGTVAYMSPEQVLGQPTDARSDIFAIGNVLYELATGRPAFLRANEIATCHAVAYEEPQAPREIREEIPEGLALVIGKCIAKEPDQRYASATELATDLQMLRLGSVAGGRALSDLRAYAPPPPRRRRRLVGGLAALVLVGALALLAWRMLDGPVEAIGSEPAVSLPVAPTSGPAAAAAGVTGKPRVIVAFFENNSGDPQVDAISRGLPEMLTTDLSRSARLEVIATQRLYDLLAMAGRDEKRGLDRSTTAELARWAGADIVISGSVFKVGEQYRIDAQAYEIAGGTVAVAHKVEGTDLFGMVDQLTEGLLAGLQVGGREKGGRTTSSEEAFEAFVVGRELYDSLRFDDAAASFQSAVELDPDFALARLHLAMSRQLLGEEELATRELGEIVARAESLSEADRLLASALDAFYRRGDFKAGEEQLEQLIERFPEHRHAYVWWGRAFSDIEGNPLRAIFKLRRAVEQSPNNLPAVVTLADHLARLGELDNARALLTGALRHNPEAAPALTPLIDQYAE